MRAVHGQTYGRRGSPATSASSRGAIDRAARGARQVGIQPPARPLCPKIEMFSNAIGLAEIRRGDRWRGADGSTYVVCWVARMGVVGFRPETAGPDVPDSVIDAVRFVTLFVPAAAQIAPARAA
jgi:hypothetical protein